MSYVGVDDINKFSLYTKEQDNKNTMQNNGIILVVKSMYFYTLKDKNPIMTFIKKSKRSTTQNLKNVHGSDENQNTSLDLTNTPSFSTHMPIMTEMKYVMYMPIVMIT
ncbi:hypothetical protein CR513_26276, partial [Mucuna pruriens]